MVKIDDDTGDVLGVILNRQEALEYWCTVLRPEMKDEYKRYLKSRKRNTIQHKQSRSRNGEKYNWEAVEETLKLFYLTASQVEELFDIPIDRVRRWCKKHGYKLRPVKEER